jgi:hypothetical protein
MTRYLSTAEFRNFTNLQTSEYSDVALGGIIDSAESWFEEQIKNRILYKASQVIEYRSGNGTNEIFTNLFPVQTFDALGFDDNDNGTYTTINLATDACTFTDTGRIVLNGGADIPVFYEPCDKKNNVKITYTPGVSTVPAYVKTLIVKITHNILNKLSLDKDIEEDIDRLRDKGIVMGLY